MQYLITYTENKVTKSFFTNWFEIENNYNVKLNMVVYDLHAKQFLTKDLVWREIEIDSL